MEAFLESPPLTLALAMAVGVFAQGIARHIYLPAIVLLLAVGVALGPDGLGAIRPALLGDGLPAIVGFAVAVILFEGGLNLDLRVLRRQAKSIRRLVTIGALLTGTGGAIACHTFMGWDWRMSALFGTLVIVTGPTVVTPLLRRIRVKHDISTILEAEGVFIDAVGATIAVVALEAALAPPGEAAGTAALGIAERFAVGGAVGIAGGAVLAVLLRWRNVVPKGLENILALVMAMALFEISDSIIPESGITAAIAAGMILGNTGSHALEEIAEFKEQLTVLLVATLFVLLAANVRIDTVQALGSAGLWTVIALVVAVRPITVFACTLGTGLTLRDKLFLSWLAPRGIVAAAVASLFALELNHAGIPGGDQLKALVFLVIAFTVVVQGLSGGLVARLLGVRRARNTGYLFLGANALSRYLAMRLGEGGEPAVLVDANVDECRAAEEAGHKVIYGNGLETRTLTRARADARLAVVGLTSNESVNLLFARKVVDDFPGPKAYVAVEIERTGVTDDMVEAIDGRVLFGGARGLGGWISRWRRGDVDTARFTYLPEGDASRGAFDGAPLGDLLPLLIERDGKPVLVDDRTKPRRSDVVEFAVLRPRRVRALAWLADAGWQPVGPVATPEAD